MSQRQAADVLWLLTSFRAFDHLHGCGGLSARAAGRLLSELASAVIEGAVPFAGGGR